METGNLPFVEDWRRPFAPVPRSISQFSDQPRTGQPIAKRAGVRSGVIGDVFDVPHRHEHLRKKFVEFSVLIERWALRCVQSVARRRYARVHGHCMGARDDFLFFGHGRVEGAVQRAVRVVHFGI